jgi:LPXTG-site transpeptidase (sortase) family protein
VRTEPDMARRRGKGLAWVLAAFGALLTVAALTVTFEHVRGDAAARDALPTGPPRHLHHSERPTRRGSATVAGQRATRTAAVPVRLTVPALAISARVTPIAERSSVLTPPSDPHVLGWWRGGALPGVRRGTAIITGHTVHTGGGAFDHLGDLARGDRIRLQTRSGPLEYSVTSVADESKSWLAAHAARVFSQTVPGRLALVTCTDWTGTVYLSNTVVLATLSTR